MQLLAHAPACAFTPHLPRHVPTPAGKVECGTGCVDPLQQCCAVNPSIGITCPGQGTVRVQSCDPALNTCVCTPGEHLHQCRMQPCAGRLPTPYVHACPSRSRQPPQHAATCPNQHFLPRVHCPPCACRLLEVRHHLHQPPDRVLQHPGVGGHALRLWLQVRQRLYLRQPVLRWVGGYVPVWVGSVCLLLYICLEKRRNETTIRNKRQREGQGEGEEGAGVIAVLTAQCMGRQCRAAGVQQQGGGHE